MRQVLFYIPLGSFNLPVYGYGMMLFLAFILCSWLAGRLARREGIDPKVLPDLAIWLFVVGILGARITFVAQEWSTFAAKPWGWGHNSISWLPDFAYMPWSVIALWDGGLVLYGSLIGGALGYFIAYRKLLAPANVSSWKMADILAPCIALGVGLGRVGCLLTGCCFGNVVCTSCPAIEFPLPSYPTQTMAQLGYQTLAGFTVDPTNLLVVAVEPGSPAEESGLKPDDQIVRVNGLDVSGDRRAKNKEGRDILLNRYDQLASALISGWPPGVHQLNLTVRRGGDVVELPAFLPVSLPLHPTQVYETISMGLLLFLLLAYYPFKKFSGSVMVLFMLGYGLHRFLNEMLRIDNPPLAFGLTFSQLVSLGVLLGAAVLAYFVFVRRASAPPVTTPAVNTW